MGTLFGNDSIKGAAVTELTCELAMQTGRAAAVVLGQKCHGKARIYVGKDTRLSSDVLEAALTAGICSVGADAVLLGTVPSPAVSYLVKKHGADGGIMITAPLGGAEQNGIKIFSPKGMRISDDTEEEIEKLVNDPEAVKEHIKGGAETGHILHDKNAQWDYVRYIMKTVEHSLSGVRVAIDCGNGSACETAEKLFTGLGATAVLINNTPDGTNINDNCGSGYLASLSNAVVKNKCHIGVAFDGDAGRCLAVDENGAVIDGDKLIAIFAKDMRDKGTLVRNTVVVTTMANLGFTNFAKTNNINISSTKFGDKYIIDQMLTHGFNLGGDQTGNIIFGGLSSTGDGQLAAAQLLSVYKRCEHKASELARIMERYPQVIINTKISPAWKEKWKNDSDIETIISDNQKLLGSTGRIIVRESSSEPIIRVMVEGKHFDIINDIAVKISDKIKERCSAV